jgi:FtsP/CotA-like multicopper oxidase with cupredoxin domain
MPMKRAIAALVVRSCLGCLVLISSAARASVSAGKPPAEPPVFISSHHHLDLLVIAEPSVITLGDRHPTAWVFEICSTSVARNNHCPRGSGTFAPYGGIRLQLEPGDRLRMRLINWLPPTPADAVYAHGSDPMMNQMLAANPVNLHTHGLIVEPRQATAANPTWGDYSYLLAYPAGKLPSMATPHHAATDQPVQYDIVIPPHHPPGLYWFHPHVHGLNINQLSEGLSGIITIGHPSDYASLANHASIPERYLILKDMQIMGNNDVVDQQDSAFCAPFDYVQVQRNGLCQGRNTSGSDGDLRPPPGTVGAAHLGPGLHHLGSTGADYTGGLWYFTINGVVYPQIPAPTGAGELWRILNAGASRTYDLVLRDDQTKAPLPFQIVSVNGASVAPPAGTLAPGTRVPGARAASGATADSIPCPAALTASPSTPPICATHLVLFPGARAEIWITPQPHPATLLTEMVSTGPAGDRWPQANLAHLAAAQGPTPQATLLDVRPAAQQNLPDQGAIATAPPAASTASPACTALPSGHRRRIFFGVPSSNPNGYGLGYEEVDENGHPVPGTFKDIAAFDPSVISVCLPLGPHNAPVTEEWELVNVSAEAHNFHMHQTQFFVLPENAPPGNAGRRMDNVAIPNGGATCDGTVAKWRDGRCKVATVIVRIPFTEPGDFVYHCHIGEHQDGGMMAHIRVIASQ